jgi:dienelactone hydrolase
MGFGSGGRWALLAACTYPETVNACIAFYPTGIDASRRHGVVLLDRLHAIRCPVVLFYGAQDRKIPARERELLAGRLTALGKNADIQVFRDADHDFFASDRDTHDISSSRAAWTTSLALLRKAARQLSC